MLFLPAGGGEKQHTGQYRKIYRQSWHRYELVLFKVENLNKTNFYIVDKFNMPLLFQNKTAKNF